MLVVSRIFIAIRILKNLEITAPELMSTTNMSRVIGIPRPYLRKVSHQLIRAGYVKSARGRDGGLSLARVPSAIQLGEIWKVIDETRNVPRNPFVDETVPSDILEDALKRFVDVLNEYTLADLPLPPRAQGNAEKRKRSRGAKLLHVSAQLPVARNAP
jgi:Rrf2 family nitric oxide-sensitive transcriptional repressor